MTEDVRAILWPLRGRVKAFTCVMDGFATIVINEALSPAARRRAYEHEMEHLRAGDFDAIIDGRMTACEAEEIRHHVVRED